MTDLAEILRAKNFSEPPEIAAIKKYVIDHFSTTVGVTIRSDAIVITAASASLANTLRLAGPKISKDCQLTKKLLFRIG